MFKSSLYKQEHRGLGHDMAAAAACDHRVMVQACRMRRQRPVLRHRCASSAKAAAHSWGLQPMRCWEPFSGAGLPAQRSRPPVPRNRSCACRSAMCCR